MTRINFIVSFNCMVMYVNSGQVGYQRIEQIATLLIMVGTINNIFHLFLIENLKRNVGKVFSLVKLG